MKVREAVAGLVEPDERRGEHDLGLFPRSVRRRITGAATALRIRIRIPRRPIGRRFGLGTAGDDLGQLAGGVESGETDEDLLAAARAPVDQRHAPPGRKRAEDILQGVDRPHGAAGHRHHLVVIPQPTAVGVGRFENVGDDDPSVVGAGDRRPEGGMIDEASPFQAAEELAELVRRDRVADTDVHPAPLLERGPPVDPDHPPLRVEQAAPRIAGIDGRIDLETVGVLEDRAGRELVAPCPGDDPGADRRAEVGGEEEGIARREAEVSHLDQIAVGELGKGEIVATDELDQGHVAGRIEADEDGVVELSIREAALHRHAGGLDDVEVRERVAIRADEDPRAPPRLTGEDRHRRLRGTGNRLDPLLFRGAHRCSDVRGRRVTGGEKGGEEDGVEKEDTAHREGRLSPQTARAP